MAKRTSNEQELQELQGEGGSDVFTTTRHINYNQHQPADKSFKLEDFKLKFWSNDDSPVIRPAVLTPKWPKGYNAPVPPKTGDALTYGTGECERVTVLMARSNYTKFASFVAITLLGTSVFGGLILFKGNKRKNAQNCD